MMRNQSWRKSILLLAAVVACDSSIAPTDSLAPAARLINVVLFDSDRSGHFGIYAMNLDGSSPRLLTPPSETASCPRVSPDGAWIAYLQRIDAGTTAAILVRADGAHRTEL